MIAAVVERPAGAMRRLAPPFLPSAYDPQALDRFIFRARLYWRFTPREAQVAYLVCCGHTEATTLAALMGTKAYGVKNHKTALYRKLAANCEAHAVALVWREFLRAHAGRGEA